MASPEDQLQLYRLQRHAFLNHLQLMAGWLQLGKINRVAAAIQQANAWLAAEEVYLELRPAELALWLLELRGAALQIGVDLTVVQPGTQLPASAMRAAISAAVLAAGSAAARRGVAALRLGLKWAGAAGAADPPTAVATLMIAGGGAWSAEDRSAVAAHLLSTQVQLELLD